MVSWIYLFSSVEHLARAIGNEHLELLCHLYLNFSAFVQRNQSPVSSPSPASHPNINDFILLPNPSFINNQIERIVPTRDACMVGPNPHFLSNFQFFINAAGSPIECKDTMLLGNTTDCPAFKRLCR